MLFLVPHLFPPAALLETACHDLRVPGLQSLLARGSRIVSQAEGVEGALCAALGVARQQDWPIAPMTLEADGGVAGDAYWLRADPVHLQVMRDRIVLADGQAATLTREEADTLASAVADHFGESLRPLPLHPQRWYLRLPAPPDLVTTPPSRATGRDIDPLLPQGTDAMRFRALLNELQMLLHDHPINQRREAHGLFPVNSLWLWGGGCRPAVPAAAPMLYADNPDARALAAYCGAPVHALPARLTAMAAPANSVVLLDRLAEAGQSHDAWNWRAGLRELEEHWFAPLRADLRTIGRQGVQLYDPLNGRSLRLEARDAWKFWRRGADLCSALA